MPDVIAELMYELGTSEEEVYDLLNSAEYFD